MGASFAKAPLDSAGTLRVLDNFLSLSEMVKEQENQLGSMNTLLGEIKEKIPERPPYRTPPAETEPARPPPRVIDLQSRLPPVVRATFMPNPAPGPGIATVTFSDGTRQAIREEDLRGFIP